MDMSYFQKINNTYKSQSKQETDLYLLNRHVEECFADTIDYHVVKRNGEPYELLIIKDTDGNTFKKKIKARPSAPFNLGDYIEWNGQIWLITLLDPNEKTYHSGYMYLCTVPLRWQNSEGKIIERFAYSEDFTKYSSGTTGNNTITIGDNQYGLTLPVDDETRKLKRDMRFPIDFEDAEQPDIYELTNRKVNLNNNEYFGRGGTMVVTMSYDAFNKDKDKRVVMENGNEVWICDYNEIDNTGTNTPSEDPTTPPENPNETTDLRAKIMFKGDQELKIGGTTKTLTGNFVDSDGNATADIGVWEVITIDELLPYLEYTITDNTLKIKVLDTDLIDSKVRIMFSSADGTVSTYLDFNVVSMF